MRYTIQFRDIALTDRRFDSVASAVKRGLARAADWGPFDVSDRHGAIVWAWEQRAADPVQPHAWEEQRAA